MPATIATVPSDDVTLRFARGKKAISVSLYGADAETVALAHRLVNCWTLFEDVDEVRLKYPTYAELVNALRRYVDRDPCRDVPGDTPAAQAVPLLARIPTQL